MKQTLPAYGVFAALIAIIGLGLLAGQLIFSSDSGYDGASSSRDQQQDMSGEIRPDMESHLKRPPMPMPESEAQPEAPSDISQGKHGETESATNNSVTMVPGSALKNRQLSEMTGIYGKSDKIILPTPANRGSSELNTVPTQQIVEKKIATAPKAVPAQGFFSKMFYGDRAKMAAEKRAKEQAAAALAYKKKQAEAEILIDAAINGAHRKDYKVKRDIYRHPKETLMFFGLMPEMTVIEMWPGEGDYTEIIAPALKGKGLLYSANWDRQLKTRAIDKALKRYTEKFIKHPEIYGKVVLTSLSEHRVEIAPPNSADLIFSSRNMYSWMRKKMDAAVFRGMFTALKPGGILGIVDHRQAAGTYQDPRAMSGYVTEKHVIDMAQTAGFVLVAKSEINANPKDLKKYPRGVFSLPPVLKEGRRNRKKYLAIGESDRMTLKFMKPMR